MFSCVKSRPICKAIQGPLWPLGGICDASLLRGNELANTKFTLLQKQRLGRSLPGSLVNGVFMSFKVGDVVKLKSGGPKMTVETEASEGWVSCRWFRADAYATDSFHEATLNTVESSPAGKLESSPAKKEPELLF